MNDIKELILNNCDVWGGKTNTDLIVEKINEIIKLLNELKKSVDNN